MPETPEPVISPELDEVHQQEHVPQRPDAAVPVHVDGPVRVQQLPARIAAVNTITVETAVQQILGKDARRSRAVLVAHDEPMLISLESGGPRMLWPIDVPLELHHSGAIYARAETASTAVGVLVEQWAD